jgi:hypothetical protein
MRVAQGNPRRFSRWPLRRRPGIDGRLPGERPAQFEQVAGLASDFIDILNNQKLGQLVSRLRKHLSDL